MMKIKFSKITVGPEVLNFAKANLTTVSKAKLAHYYWLNQLSWTLSYGTKALLMH